MKTGKVSESVLKRSVLKQVNTNPGKEIVSGASVGADCAIFAFSGADAARVMTVMQEAAVAVKADMRRIILRTANSLACAGAVPVAAMISLLLPESIEEEQIREYMAEARSICESLDMTIVGGQTNVSGDVSMPHVSVTGIGRGDREHTFIPGGAGAGQDIVITKWIGLEGTSLIANAGAEKLTARYPLHLIEEAQEFHKYMSVLPEAQIACRAGATAMHDISEGGVFRALWELAESAGTGLTVDLKKIPVRQETIEVCEFFQINPYELLSGGSLIVTTDDGEALVQALEAAQIPAKVVGKITDNNDRVVTNEEETRFLERPKTDEIYKVSKLWNAEQK